MKVLAVFILCALGLALAETPVEPVLAVDPVPEAPEPECAPKADRPVKTLAEISRIIHELKFKATVLGGAMKRFRVIGKAAIAKLDAIIDKAGQNPKCLNLEVFQRPAPVTIPEDRPIVAPPAEVLSLAEVSSHLHQLKHDVKVLGERLLRFREIGRENIGRLNRFVHAVRQGVCGAKHHHPCPPDYLAYGSTCYKEVIARQKSWQAAQALCHAEGAHLASINSAEENMYILTLLQQSAPGHSVWIGLNRLKTPSWTWVHSNTAPTYQNWNSCKPIEDSHKCAYLCMGSKKFTSSDCSTPRRVLCQKAQTSATPVTLPAQAK